MKITVNEDKVMQLEEVFNSILLKTPSGESMYICMRDSGFEFTYEGKWYYAQNGHVGPMISKATTSEDDVLCSPMPTNKD